MDKESIFELQKINCNCNDCGYMVRNMDLYKESLVNHERWQLNHFDGVRDRMKQTAKVWRDRKNDLAKWDSLMTEAENMKFQFDKSTCSINYGQCSKFDKPVTFLPNVLQLDTQTCFKHRKEI